MKRAGALCGAWVFLPLVGGCVVAIPPPIDPAGLPACAAGNYGVLGREPCERDAECHACEVGETCVASGDGSCRPGSCWVACCEGRCTVLTEAVLAESGPAESGFAYE